MEERLENKINELGSRLEKKINNLENRLENKINNLGKRLTKLENNVTYINNILGIKITDIKGRTFNKSAKIYKGSNYKVTPIFLHTDKHVSSNKKMSFVSPFKSPDDKIDFKLTKKSNNLD